MGEFELIDAIVEQLGSASRGSQVVVGPGDDAAVVAVPEGHHLVTSVDTLVSDLHFPADAPARLIAERALRVSVSDIAAMGAQPLAAVVALVLPKSTSAEWVRELSAGFSQAAKVLGCPVTGGNLTSGQLSISVTVQGVVPEGRAILRSGALPGHEVWVTGALGGAALALSRSQSQSQSQSELAAVAADGSDLSAPQRCYYLPKPQITVGIGLRGHASSAIDISDGLAADLDHVAQHSRVSVRLHAADIPCFEGATLEHALYGGDDYMLCFTAPVESAHLIRSLAPSAQCIGHCIEQAAERLSLDGAPLEARGFDHFKSSGAT